MSETDNNTQRQKPKISKLAIASLIIPLVSVFSFLLGIVFSLTGHSKLLQMLVEFIGFNSVVGSAIAIGLGVLGMLKIYNSKKALKGTGYAIAGIIISVSLVGLIMISVYCR